MSYFHFSKQKHVFLLIILSRDLDDGQMLKISDFPLLSAHNWFYLSARQQGTVSFYSSYNKKPMQGFSMCKENKILQKLLSITAHVRRGVRIAGSVPSCAAGLMVPPADSLWETMVTLILALLEALLGVGLGVCLLLPCDLSSSLSRPSIWSLVTGTAPRTQTKQGQTQAWTPQIFTRPLRWLCLLLSSCDHWIQILNLKANFYCPSFNLLNLSFAY